MGGDMGWFSGTRARVGGGWKDGCPPSAGFGDLRGAHCEGARGCPVCAAGAGGGVQRAPHPTSVGSLEWGYWGQEWKRKA